MSVCLFPSFFSICGIFKGIFAFVFCFLGLFWHFLDFRILEIQRPPKPDQSPQKFGPQNGARCLQNGTKGPLKGAKGPQKGDKGPHTDWDYAVGRPA